MDVLIFVVIFLSVATGFFLGRSNLFSQFRKLPRQSFAHNRYVEGLKYLLNEQPDSAIDALVADLEINQDSLEMYFSLGVLWRKRGEMERAIRVHQALLESLALTPLQRQQVQLELALDYSHSGVLDRSEVLLKELVADAFPSVQQSAGRELVLLYQEEREWERAVVAADELCGKGDIPDIRLWRHLQAHYCCELAERALDAPDWNGSGLLSNGIPMRSDGTSPVPRLLAQAEYHAPNHPRVLLLRSLLALGQHDLAFARQALHGLKLRSDYSMVMVPLLLSVGECDRGTLWSDLMNFYQDSHDVAVLPFLADLVCRKDGSERAMHFLIQELRTRDEQQPLAGLLAAAADGSAQYDNLRPALREMLPFRFHCHQCGFQGRQFYWCCPSCKTWL
jgi:lipopolysaccharide biosynthesis regulator YciM